MPNEITNLPTSLDACTRLDDETLFTKPVLAHALALLEAEAGDLVPDVQTLEGRQHTNKLARAVGGAINRLDKRRRDYVAALKARPKAVDDLFRENFRKPAEELKEDIRRPLDEWTAAQQRAAEETDRILSLLRAPVEQGTTAEELHRRLTDAKNIDLPAWASEIQREEIANEMQIEIPRLERAHRAAIEAEQQAAELERLREIERQAEIRAAQDAAAAEARQEEAARQEAERIQAQHRQEAAERRAAEAEERLQQQQAEAEERQRQQEEARRQEEERRERAKHEALRNTWAVNLSIATAIVDIIDATRETRPDATDWEIAREIVTGIADGEINHLSINYNQP